MIPLFSVVPGYVFLAVVDKQLKVGRCKVVVCYKLLRYRKFVLFDQRCFLASVNDMPFFFLGMFFRYIINGNRSMEQSKPNNKTNNEIHRTLGSSHRS